MEASIKLKLKLVVVMSQALHLTDSAQLPFCYFKTPHAVNI